MTLRAPFPWFGGKSRVADIVWKRFGDVPNYVEPFAGSLAVLLSRPHWPWDGHRIETVNDMDCYLANFWRALQADPDEVASWCDWPVNEADLHARHLWLVNTARERVGRLRTEPDFYDAKIAGWWVYGICQWIGSGWCSHPEWQQPPHLGNAGIGVHRTTNGDLREYLSLLSDRIRGVRVCCGDWSRVCGEAPTVKQGLTGVFLDPPYSAEAGRDENIYAVENLTVAHDVREWAIEHGDDPKLRIALCGYDGEHAMPASWECVAWKTSGGYSSQNSRGSENAGRERIWFSPHCIQVDRVVQRDLFAEVQ